MRRVIDATTVLDYDDGQNNYSYIVSPKEYYLGVHFWTTFEVYKYSNQACAVCVNMEWCDDDTRYNEFVARMIRALKTV